MTIYDAAMAILVVGGMVWGAFRGITWQLASIASLVVGYSVAHPLSAQLAPSFPGDPAVARALAMLASYALVSGGIFLAAWLVRATLQKMKFEAYDRHLGMLLGGLEGALLGMVVTLFVVSLAPSSRAPIFASPTGQVVGQVMAAVGPVLPTEVRAALAPSWKGSAGADLGAVASEREAGAESSPLGLGETRDADSSAAADRKAPRILDVIQKEEDRLGKTLVDSAKQALGPADGERPGAGGGLRETLRKEEDRLGRTIVDSAKQELQRIGEANERDLERR